MPYIYKVKELGFDVLEINAGTIATMGADEKKRLNDAAAETGIQMSCCIGLPPSSDLASSDIAVRQAGIDHLNRIGDVMTECRIDRLSGISDRKN